MAVSHLLRGFELQVDEQHLWASLSHGIIYPDSRGKGRVCLLLSLPLAHPINQPAEVPRREDPPTPTASEEHGERGEEDCGKERPPIFETPASFTQQARASSSRCIRLMRCRMALNSGLSCLLPSLI